MTKEEILDDITVMPSVDYITRKATFKAMDEYAEQEAIGFYVWGITRAFHLDAAEKRSIKELYQLYLKSKP